MLTVLLWQACKALELGWLFNDPNVQSGFELIPAFIISGTSIFSALFPLKSNSSKNRFLEMEKEFIKSNLKAA